MTENHCMYFLCTLFTCIAICVSPCPVMAQDIPGELVFEEPFEGEDLMPGWYMVQRNDASAQFLGMIEEGPMGGQAFVMVTTTPPTVILNHLQFSNEAFARPEGSDQFDYRVTFWIRTKVVPFTIRPIIAMSADPWTGTSVDVPIENADEWTLVDVTLPGGEFLNTDPLLFIFHMGNPGDEFDVNEVWFDDLKVYLLNQTDIPDWSVY